MIVNPTVGVTDREDTTRDSDHADPEEVGSDPGERRIDLRDLAVRLVTVPLVGLLHEGLHELGSRQEACRDEGGCSWSCSDVP